MPFTKAKTKREAVVRVLEEFNRRQRMAELVKYSGTFGDSFPTNEQIEAVDVIRDLGLHGRRSCGAASRMTRNEGRSAPLADLLIFACAREHGLDLAHDDALFEQLGKLEAP